MDVIRNLAKDFSRNLVNYGYTLEKFEGELDSKLIYVSKTNEKIRFLSYLRDLAETQYKEHAPKCKNPENCGTNQALEIALYSINQKLDEYIEENGLDLSERPAMKFFTEGQYFDAFSAIKEIIKEAKQSIVLVDGYVNTETLAYFPSKEPNIKLRILTSPKSNSDEFQHTIKIYNKQYENLNVKSSNNFHDRFLILDDSQFYHIGASIKDAGNKTFMYSKIEDLDIINLIRNKILSEWRDIYEN